MQDPDSEILEGSDTRRLAFRGAGRPGDGYRKGWLMRPEETAQQKSRGASDFARRESGEPRLRERTPRPGREGYFVFWSSVLRAAGSMITWMKALVRRLASHSFRLASNFS